VILIGVWLVNRQTAAGAERRAASVESQP
jgi:hypothetical protein